MHEACETIFKEEGEKQMTTIWTVDQMDQEGNVLESTEFEDPTDEQNAWSLMYAINHFEDFTSQIPKHTDCVWISIRKEGAG